MFLRALVLTVLIICTVAVTLPLTDSLANWSSRTSAARRDNGRHTRRRSRAWWRRYRARLRRQRAVAAERRRRRSALLMASGKPVSPFGPAANHATLILGDARKFGLPAVPLPTTASLSSIVPVMPITTATPLSPAAATVLPAPRVSPVGKEVVKESPRPSSALPLPKGWSSAASSRTGETHFSVRAADGRVRSSAVWSRVNVQAATSSSVADARSKNFGGVPVAVLRRTVINRMVAEGGWVLNDVQRQFGERRVLVVTAQSIAAGGERRAWTFYFTESDGQVYSLATNAPLEFADALAAESEQAVVALGSRRANSTSARYQH